MPKLSEYKCLNCNGALKFDSKLQKLKCPFCDSTFTVDELSKLDSQLGGGSIGGNSWAQDITPNTWADGETDGLYSYVCRSCGGEIIGDANMAATSCPYCGNPVVVLGAFTGKLKPDYVIPFKLSKDEAVAALGRHLQGKRLLPKVFKDENKLKEIKGVYVPFWVFDSELYGDYSYKTTTVHKWSDKYYDYTETKFYDVYREGNISFRSVPIDGSEKFDDALMESIEPFDFSEAVDFKTAYLAGYLADKFDVNTDVSWQRAGTRMANTTQQSFYDTVTGYASVRQNTGDCTVLSKSAKYALFPVWLLSTVWKGETYTFAMNGQTGKFVGDLPVDKKAAARWLIGLGLGIAAAIFLVTLLFI
ncbi:MAG: hypothetical protein II789_06020 [Clostridia bacterium]|nr:hypothetical protein [Clostridia bacterium]